MSASSTPTAKPVGGQRGGQVDGDRRLADAALARGDGEHPGGGGHRGVGRLLARRSSGPWPWPPPSPRRSARSSRASTLGHAGQRADPGLDVALDLGPQRAPGGGEGDRDRRPRRRATTSAPLAMPSSTMSLPSSGSMTPRSSPITSSGWGGGEPAGSGIGTADFTGIGRVILGWCRRSPGSPGGAGPAAGPGGPARRPPRHPQGARRQHPLRHLPRAGPLAASRCRPPTSADVARPARQHRAAPPRAHARGRAARGRHRGPRRGRPARSTATRWPPTPRRSASSRRRCPPWPARCWPPRHAAGLTADELADAGRDQGRDRRRRSWPDGDRRRSTR